MSYSKDSIFVDIPCDRLQEIRLVHALSEAGTTIIIPSDLISRFRLLGEKLGMKFQVGMKGDLLFSKYIRISHEEPITAFSNIQRPLVFPMAMVNKCKAMWSEKREYRFSFAGLITESRRDLISEWVLRNFNSDLPDSTTSIDYWWTSLLPSRIKQFIPNKTTKVIRRVGDLTFWSSNYGRLFPGKSWDEEYFKLLSQSQFVLCPKGDCLWSYRFFESILCGAIPIVEKECVATNGFEYYTFSDEVESLKWSKDKATYNFNRLVSNFTITLEEINTELANIGAR
jgi:hypothetical protein